LTGDQVQKAPARLKRGAAAAHDPARANGPGVAGALTQVSGSGCFFCFFLIALHLDFNLDFPVYEFFFGFFRPEILQSVISQKVNKSYYRPELG
jgi:hypothetical protein